MSDKLRFGEILVRAGVLSREVLEQTFATLDEQTDLGEMLVAQGHLDEAALLGTIGRALNLPGVRLQEVVPDPKALELVDRADCIEHFLLPISIEQGRTGAHLHVAMANPADVRAIKKVTRKARLRIRPLVALASEIRAAVARAYGGAVAPGPADGRAPPSPVAAPARSQPAAETPLFDFGVEDLSSLDSAEASPPPAAASLAFAGGLSGGVSKALASAPAGEPAGGLAGGHDDGRASRRTLPAAGALHLDAAATGGMVGGLGGSNPGLAAAAASLAAARVGTPTAGAVDRSTRRPSLPSVPALGLSVTGDLADDLDDLALSAVAASPAPLPERDRERLVALRRTAPPADLRAARTAPPPPPPLTSLPTPPSRVMTGSLPAVTVQRRMIADAQLPPTSTLTGSAVGARGAGASGSGSAGSGSGSAGSGSGPLGSGPGPSASMGGLGLAGRTTAAIAEPRSVPPAPAGTVESTTEDDRLDMARILDRFVGASEVREQGGDRIIAQALERYGAAPPASGEAIFTALDGALVRTGSMSGRLTVVLIRQLARRGLVDANALLADLKRLPP